MNAGDITEAAVGVIQRNDGMVLLGERPVGKPWSGYWEFPGGKIELGEAPAHALARELQEELGIVVVSFYPWLTRTYHYEAKYDAFGVQQSPAKTVRLHFFIVTDWQGTPKGLESQMLSWQSPEHLTVAPMLPANAPIVNALSLPPVYAISNLKEMGERLFFGQLFQALQQGLKMILVRENQLSSAELRSFAAKVCEIASSVQANVFVHSNIHLARQLKAAGVHLSSATLMQLQAKPEGLLCGASCHNEIELAHAQALQLDYVMLSPVSVTLSHPETQPLGWNKFKALIENCSVPVYALGGMVRDDLHIARLHGAHGIAAQRALWL